MKTIRKSKPQLKLLLLFLWLVFFQAELFASVFNFSERLDSIQIYVNASELRLPGESFQINVMAFYKNGKVKNSNNLFRNAVSWSRFKVEVRGGSFCFGKVWVSENLMPAKGKYILVKVYPKRAPHMAKRLLLALNYEQKIEIIPLGNLVKAPGFGFKFKLQSTFDSGVTRTIDYRFWNKHFDLYRLIVNGGNFRLNQFVIDPDFRNIYKHQVSIEALSMRNPECTAKFNLVLDYKANYNLSYSGSDGWSGSSGSSGSSGTSGNSGGNGQHGQHGGDGGDGPDIGVWADLYFDSILATELLYIYAENLWTGREHYYLLNPDGGRLFVNSSGGNGGRGGSGGDGGNGGHGSDGAWHTKKIAVTDSTTITKRWQDPGQNGGNGGHGGCGGRGGNGGYGGDIYLYFSFDADDYSYAVIPDSEGGWSGRGGSSGSGGKGGSGGSGSPNGNSGSNGSSGHIGPDGWSGTNGNFFYQRIDDFIEYEPIASRNKEL